MTVSFPGIGLSVSINRVAFTLFGIPIYWYGIIIALGFIAGIAVATVASKKLGEEDDTAIDIALVCAPLAIVCARLYYVIFKWEEYSRDLASVFDVRSGGLAIYGGIIGAVISAIAYAKIKKKSLLTLLDIGSVGLITGQMIGRWGNFFNQEAFGGNTTLPWGMTSNAIKEYLQNLQQSGVDVNPELPVHPTFLYESLWSFMVLGCLLYILYRCYRFKGQMILAYASLYGLGRFWIEGLRTDSLMIGTFRVSQVLAFLSFIVFGIIYFVLYKKHRNEKIDENNIN